MLCIRVVRKVVGEVLLRFIRRRVGRGRRMGREGGDFRGRGRACLGVGGGSRSLVGFWGIRL